MTNYPKLFGTLLKATHAYSALLDEGIDQDDRKMANSAAYAELLSAGRALHREGGPPAVAAAADFLARCFAEGSIRHFSRLWAGLMADPVPH